MTSSGTLQTDILVVGSGLAGCIAAMTAADRGKRVLLVTKSSQVQSGSSAWAQGYCL